MTTARVTVRLDRGQLGLLCLALDELRADPDTETETVVALAPLEHRLRVALRRAWGPQ